MGINTEIERLYWNTAQKEIIADRGDFGGYYAHLEDIFMTLVKGSQGKDLRGLKEEESLVRD